MMQTSLRGIAIKAASNKEYKFHNLYGLLTLCNLLYCWRFINLKSTPGVDKEDPKEYAKNLLANVMGLVDVLKRGVYRAKLILRKYIPKLNGKLRPLGLPSIADKLLQTAVARILRAIYEQDFLKCSFGYRPNLGAHDALRELSAKLRSGTFRFVVEADIKGFFDNINHQILLQLLGKRIADKSLLGLILKWLKAGILDTTGLIIHPATGVPQGGIVSPILANVYLHYGLDLWFETVVKAQCRREAYLCRYADDFVCLFQYEADAKWFYEALAIRLKEYDLELAEDKTLIIEFRPVKGTKPKFDFLGFEFKWGRNRWGRQTIIRRTSRKKYRASIANFKEWIKKHRNLHKSILFSKLNSKLQGYYNYYGLRCNLESMADYFYQIKKILLKWLNRRSQRKSYNWAGFKDLLLWYKVLRPRIKANF